MDARRARVRCLAKVNLSLRVLHKRADNYHELRTIFQSVSLADELEIEFQPGRFTRIELESELDIPPETNLITRAAQAFFDVFKVKGSVRFRLTKRIPMGGGLGGGSSDAAAVLLAFAALAGRRTTLEELSEIGAELGSDVPFFLYGGAALGIGRGTELYPLPDLPARPALIVAPPLHVSTPDAYRALNRGFATDPAAGSLQAFAWKLDLSPAEFAESDNDFESAVFRQHPRLSAIKRELLKMGARPALMSGSGSAVFGVFETADARDRAARRFSKEKSIPVKLVSRRSYRRMWLRQLAAHVTDTTSWPPQSRYGRR